jgi:hypothetical protein
VRRKLISAFAAETPFARMVAEALSPAYFTLLDVGCSGGIDPAWRTFGERLRAFGFDPNIEEIQRLAARETLAGVRYIAQFVSSFEDDAPETLRTRSRLWARNPWSRLSTARTLARQTASRATAGGREMTDLNLWNQLPLANLEEAVVLPAFLREERVDDVDFIKIDVDGADFVILRSLVPTLAETNVLGLAVEVNFFGSADPEIHTFHNVDRLLKGCGFELFSLGARPYSVAALPAPYQLSVPAQTKWGRILQGDALYFRDAAAPENKQWASALGEFKLAKLAALFSLAGLPDCAAEVLQEFRNILRRIISVEAGLDALVLQLPEKNRPASYTKYIAEFEADSAYFYPATYAGSNEPPSEGASRTQPTPANFFEKLLRRKT